MDRNWSIDSKTLIEPRGGGVSQWMTTTPVENSTPSSTMPVPETPDASCSRCITNRRIPSGARSVIVAASPSLFAVAGVLHNSIPRPAPSEHLQHDEDD